MALRSVDLHGWSTDISEDHSRLRMTGGSVSLELGLSAAVTRYIEGVS